MLRRKRADRFPCASAFLGGGWYLLSLLAACSPSGTNYAGTVTNSGLPNSPSKLSLTVLSTTDTSFAGYLSIAPPLGGSGQVYGWFPGGTLTMVTVSVTGDTIVWNSRSDGRQIGG